MTYLEEYLLRQNYSLLCEMLFLPANIVQGNIMVRSFIYVSD